VPYRTETLCPPRLRAGPDAEGNLIGNSNRSLGRNLLLSSISLDSPS
jgi:hypothetical protein